MEMQHTTLTLQPGIYILRHPGNGMAPMSIGRAYGGDSCDGRVEAMFTPGTHGTLLRTGADCIVLQLFNAPVALLVTAYLERTGDPTPALRVDQIGLAPASPTSPARSGNTAQERTIEIPPEGISVIGHIERMGDVVAMHSQQLGEPSTGLRLEGFQVMWPDKPEGVELVYSVSIEGHGTTAPAKTGNFVGTRGEGRRITEVNFSLVGKNADVFTLDGDAWFSGGFQVPIGAGESLSGPSGLEHLSALRINVRAGKAQKKSQTSSNPWENPSRTKVLKSKSATKK